MKYFFVLAIISSSLLLSCTNDNKPAVATLPPTNTDTTTFFSLKNFFVGEIKSVTETPFYIYIKTINPNKQTDSLSCSKEQFTQLATQFVACDISAKEIKGYYKETAFRDLSTKSITLNYSTTNKELPVQNIDILLDDETHKVKRIFIRKVVNANGKYITSLYSWKTGKRFMINTTTSTQKGEEAMQQLVSWNDTEE